MVCNADGTGEREAMSMYRPDWLKATIKHAEEDLRSLPVTSQPIWRRGESQSITQSKREGGSQGQPAVKTRG